MKAGEHQRVFTGFCILRCGSRTPLTIGDPRMPLHGGKLAARALKNAGVEVRLHALRRPHHAALRRLHRRGHPDRRRAPRAGRRARRRRLGALQSRQDRRRGDHRGPRRDRRRHRHRERLARQLADPRDRRPGPVREPAPRLAPGDGSRRRRSARSRSTCDALYQTKRIPEYIELAIRHAVSGIPGPTFLEIPMDVFMGQRRRGRS